jgi:hypothetical protein
MSEESKEVIKCFVTLNPEHYRLLEQLTNKTGKDKRQVLREAVELALSRGLAPSSYTWNKKRHRVIGIAFPAEQARKARQLGNLTPIAVAGLLAIAGPETQSFDVTPDDLQRLRTDLDRIIQSVRTKNETPSVPRTKRVAESANAVRAVRATLQELAEQLEYFKKGSEVERKKFRELIDPMEVGYITSLMKALFDEEGFQRWVLASEFTMGKRKNA